MFTKNDQIPNYVLDSFALLAHFQAESGGEKVKNLLDKAVISEVSLYMSIINMGEVFYITSRNFGNDTAHSQMSDIRQMPIKICGVTNDNVMAAASLKAKYKFSFFDGFAASTLIPKNWTTS